jgi:hypothetical protein
MFPCSVYFPKDPELKKLYDYLAQYFEPKIRLPQAGSKSAESLEDCQEQDAGAAGVESGESQESELEEAGPVCLHDVYAAISPQESDPSAVMARKEEKLCWTLGGDLRKTPSPSEDFESAWCKGPGDSTPPKQIELPSSVNGPVPEELMNSVRSRVMFLEQLSFSDDANLCFLP